MNNLPLEWALIEFPGNQFKGEIVPELYRLVEQGIIRIVDVVFISKDKDGGYTSVELNDLPADVYSQFVPLREHLSSLFTEEDVASLAVRVPADSAALVLLWQNTWTENFRRAVANANGKLLGQERIPAEVVDEVMAEMTASKA